MSHSYRWSCSGLLPFGSPDFLQVAGTGSCLLLGTWQGLMCWQEDNKVLREALQSAVNGLSGLLGEVGIQKVSCT